MSQHSPVVEKIGITREHAKPIPLPDNLPRVPEFEAELLPSVLSVPAERRTADSEPKGDDWGEL